MKVSESRDVSKTVAPGVDFDFRITLTNGSTQPRELHSIEMAQHARQLFTVVSPVKKPVRLLSGGAYTQQFKFNSKATGNGQGDFKATLLFNFSNWLLEYTVVVRVAHESALEDLSLLKPLAPYKPVVLPDASEPSRHMVPAFPPVLPGAAQPASHVSSLPGVALYMTVGVYDKEKSSRPLDEYPLPTGIRDIEAGHKKSTFNPWKTRNNYKMRLHEMLYLEEAQQARLTRAYDLRAVPVEAVTQLRDADGRVHYMQETPLTRFKCANLAEKRPSVQVADRVYAWRADGGGMLEYEGFVHRVEAESLLIVFAASFHTKHPDGTPMNVRFDVERLTMRLMHRAIDDTHLDVVWPTVSSARDANWQLQHDAYAETLDLPSEMNVQQRSVVASLLRREHGSAPFLLYGPFGTGKTRTLTEFLKLLLKDGGAKGKGGEKAQPSSKSGGAWGKKAAAADEKKSSTPRVLVCSPSNSSADQYVLQLSSILKSDREMLRLFAAHRKGVFDKRLRPYTSFDHATGTHTMPPLETILSTQLVVMTTRASAQLASLGVPKGHFTHIIVDEAAQLMEAESLLPLSLAGPATSVVMAGDPKQLGPSTFCKLDCIHGVHVSVMERLQSLDAYASRAPHVCQFLTANYRSHPAIVKLLSKVSYGGKLVSHAPAEKTHALSHWDKRGTKKSYPLLFCGLEAGTEEQEGDSPSVFNRQEATTLLVLIQDLLTQMGPGALKPEEVGVITPYYRQTQKLRLLLKSRGLHAVKVGSTEEFHGHEVKALFVSTVRTSQANLGHDALYDTGFVGNVKRFNTALSRAVALLVIVGDAAVLSHSDEWRELISNCRDQGCFLNLQAPNIPSQAQPVVDNRAPAPPAQAPTHADPTGAPSVTEPVFDPIAAFLAPAAAQMAPIGPPTSSPPLPPAAAPAQPAFDPAIVGVGLPAPAPAAPTAAPTASPAEPANEGKGGRGSRRERQKKGRGGRGGRESGDAIKQAGGEVEEVAAPSLVGVFGGAMGETAAEEEEPVPEWNDEPVPPPHATLQEFGSPMAAPESLPAAQQQQLLPAQLAAGIAGVAMPFVTPMPLDVGGRPQVSQGMPTPNLPSVGSIAPIGGHTMPISDHSNGLGGNTRMYESSSCYSGAASLAPGYSAPNGQAAGYAAPVTSQPGGLPAAAAFVMPAGAYNEAGAYNDGAYNDGAYNDMAYNPARAPPQAPRPQMQQQPRATHAAAITNGYAAPKLERVCLYKHAGEGVVFCEGPAPSFAVYEREEGIKLVVSTFNLTYTIDEAPNGFTMRLAPDFAKQAKATLFRSNFGETRDGATQAGQGSRVDVVLGPSFNHAAIEVHETKTRLKVMLPKKEAGRIGVTMHRVRGD